MKFFRVTVTYLLKELLRMEERIMKTLADLQASLGTLEAKMTALQSAVNALQAPTPLDLSNEVARVDALSTQVDAVSAKVATLTPPPPPPAPPAAPVA